MLGFWYWITVSYFYPQPPQNISFIRVQDLWVIGDLIPIINCDWCRKEREIYNWHFNTQKHHFCNKECYNKWKEKKRVKVNCDWCGIEFKKTFNKVGKKNYCKRRCYSKSREKKIGTCKICNKKFKKTKPKWECCSKECGIESRKNQINTFCIICKKPIKVRPNRIKTHGNFCSRACFGIWYSKNRKGKNHPSYLGNYKGRYGTNWASQRKKAWKRDRYLCQKCHRFETSGRWPHAHHIIPFRIYGKEKYEEANVLENLITLCHTCHSKVEKQYRMLSSPTNEIYIETFELFIKGSALNFHIAPNVPILKCFEEVLIIE